MVAVDIKTTVEDKVAEAFTEKVQANLKNAADYFLGVLQPKLPVDEGTLKSTAKVKRVRASKRLPAGAYRIETEYYLFFYEYGTLTPKADKVHQPARPITGPLLQAQESTLVELITEGL